MDGDSIKATPQSAGMGLFANGLGNANQFLNSNSMGWLSDMLGIPSAASLASDMSYGSPPYRGAGMATKLDPRIAETVGSVANAAGVLPLGLRPAVGLGLAAGGLSMQHNQTLDSVIQQMLNRLGNQNK